MRLSACDFADVTRVQWLGHKLVAIATTVA